MKQKYTTTTQLSSSIYVLFPFIYLFSLFEMNSHDTVAADPNITTLLSQPPKCWNYDCWPTMLRIQKVYYFSCVINN